MLKSYKSTLNKFSFAIISFLGIIAVTTAYGNAGENTDGKSNKKPAAPLTSKALKYLEIQPNDLIIGDAKAPVTIVEYMSLSCPACGHFHNQIFPEIKKKYIKTGKAKFILRSYPTNKSALKAAITVDCIDKEKRDNFVEVLFDIQDKWAFSTSHLNSLRAIALSTGLSGDKFDQCMEDKKMEDRIVESGKIAASELMVNSTPSFFINGVKYQGDRSPKSFGKAIKKLLK